MLDGNGSHERAGAGHQQNFVHPRDHPGRRTAQRRAAFSVRCGLSNVFDDAQRHELLQGEARCLRGATEFQTGDGLLGQIQKEEDDFTPRDTNPFLQKRQTLRCHQRRNDCVFQSEGAGVILSLT